MDSSDIKKRYIIRGNADQTEGRGGKVDRETFDTLEAAYDCHKRGIYGVMGQPDTEIWEEQYLTLDDQEFIGSRTILLGYKDSTHKWLVPNPLMGDDPEFKLFLELYEKYKEYL